MVPLQMIVERHMGVKTSIPVADIHKITFGQGAMHIDYQNSPQSGMPQEIALSEIKKWWFSHEVLSAVATPIAEIGNVYAMFNNTFLR